MFKKISFIITISLIAVVLLTPIDCFARGGGGRGGRGGGMMGGGMMGGGQMDPTMIGGGRGYNPTAAIDVNAFRTSTLLTYLVDANGTSIDPNKLTDSQLQDLYLQIGRSDRTDRSILDLSRFDEFVQVRESVFGQPNVDPNDPDPMISVQLNGLSINPIIEMLIRWTGKAVMPSNEAIEQLRITVYSPERMRRSEALNLLYSAMRQQGFVAETRNNIIYIKPVNQATQVHADLVSDDVDLKSFQDKLQVIRKIYKIKNYSASTMGQLIQPFLNPTGNVTAEETTRTLMVTDTVEALIQVEQIIDKFDNTLAGTTTELLKVQHTNPTELANMISTIMTSNVSSSGMLSSFNMGGMMGNMMQQGGRNTRTTNNNTRGNDRGGRGTTTTNNRNSGRTSNPTSMMSMGMFGPVSASASTIGSEKPAPTLIPDEINKVIIATAIPDDMVTVKYWMAQLDTETKVLWNPNELRSIADKNQIVQKIYHLQYNTPEQLAQIIEPLLTDDGYLSAEQNTGTLMIRDTVATLLQIEDIIKEFDKEEANPQVRQIFEVREGDPQEIVNIINAILSGQVTTGGTGTRTTGTLGRTTGGRTTTTNRNTRTTTGRTGMGGF